MAPPVSICLPVLNGQAFLSTAIDSILGQTYPHFELLISDDGSTDGSLDVINHYLKSDSRIKLLERHSPLGLFGNYNNCLRSSAGKYVKPFAQDDVLHLSFLSEAVAVMEENPTVALLSTARISIDAKGNPDDWEGITDASAVLKKTGQIASHLVEKASLFPVVNFIGEPSAVMFSSRATGEGFDTRFNHLGDLEYWLQILKKGDYFFLNKKLCFFRRHCDTASTQNEQSLLYAPDILYLCDKLLPAASEGSHVRQSFISSNVQAIAEHVAKDNTRRQSMSLVHAPQNNSEAFQRLFFHCLVQLGDSCILSRQNSTLMFYDSLRRIREKRLKGLLRSVSWRLTRPFREVNRNMLAKPSRHFDDSHLTHGANTSAILANQRDYLRYLRREIVNVRRSHSWRITRFLRIRR